MKNPASKTRRTRASKRAPSHRPTTKRRSVENSRDANSKKPVSPKRAVTHSSEVTLASPVVQLLKYRDELAKAHASYKDVAHRTLAHAYRHGRRLIANPAHWADFCAAEFWKDHARAPTEKDRPNALHYVPIMLVDANDPNGAKTASKYRQAMKALYANNVSPENAAATIKSAGGIEAYAKLAKNGAAEKASAKEKAAPAATVPVADFEKNGLPQPEEGDLFVARLRYVRTASGRHFLNVKKLTLKRM